MLKGTEYVGITERKWGEVAQAYLASIVESSSDAIFSTSKDGVITTWNAAAQQIFGYSNHEILGYPVSSIIPEGHHINLEDIYGEIVNENKSVSYESFIMHKNKTLVPVWITLSPIRDVHGSIIGVSGIVRDMSHQKKLESAIAAIHRTFQLALSASPDAILITNQDGCITYWNDGAANLFGYQEKDILGRPVSQLLPKETASKYEGCINKMLDSGFPDGSRKMVEITAKKKDDTFFPAEASIAVLDTEYGRLCCAIIRDITDRLRQEEKLVKTNEEMQTNLILARKVQEALLPSAEVKHERFKSLTVASKYIPASDLGGDFFVCLPVKQDTLGIFVGDVMGHGVRSALLTSMLYALVEELSPEEKDPSIFMTHLNRSFTHIMEKTSCNIFASGVYAQLNTTNNIATVVSAGHPAPVRVSKDGKAVFLRPSDNSPALGLINDWVYGGLSINYEPGDKFVFYTDGLTEVDPSRGKILPDVGLLELISTNANLKASALLERLLEVSNKMSSNDERHDDICLLAVET